MQTSGQPEQMYRLDKEYARSDLDRDHTVQHWQGPANRKRPVKAGDRTGPNCQARNGRRGKRWESPDWKCTRPLYH